MRLTGKQIAERGIVKGFCNEAVQQQGIDVRIDKISVVDGHGIVPAAGKTIKAHTTNIEWLNGDSEYVDLQPGYYEVELMESCDIPKDAVLNYKTRSSLVRCGAIVHSGQFDGGFNTDKMGCFLEVLQPVLIERGARIAQAVVDESYPVDDDKLYNGQWQNDNQRTK